MQYKVILTPNFEKDLKKLKRKYRNIADDIEPTLEDLEKGNIKGDVIKMNLSDDEGSAIKIRVANTDINSGKSGGYRLICYAEKSDGTIFLLTIYCKREKEDISNKEILKLLAKYCM